MKRLNEINREIGEAMEAERQEYETANNEWWNSLSEAERESAFYAVVKRIHKAELIDKGSYRWALYDVFGFDPSMYARGMDCGFMDLHNAIIDGESEWL
jgi:hypothetical protein